MKTDNKRQKVTFILLLVIMVLGGAILLLSIKILNRELWWVRGIGWTDFHVIFEDGDYENLDKAKLIWTVNNLYASGHDYKIIDRKYVYINGRRYINMSDAEKYLHINGRLVVTKRYVHKLGRGYRPKIEIRYDELIEKNRRYHLVLSREFIEAYIEASSKYAEVTDELNNLIDRLNQVKSTEIDNMTEAQIDSMVYLGPKLADETGLEQKRRELRESTVNVHFKSTNVFWIEESTNLGRYLDGEDAEPMIVGEAIFYMRKDKSQSKLLDDKENLVLSPPSNFDRHLHTDPDEEPFIWVPAGTWEFIYVDRQWKIGVIMPET